MRPGAEYKNLLIPITDSLNTPESLMNPETPTDTAETLETLKKAPETPSGKTLEMPKRAPETHSGGTETPIGEGDTSPSTSKTPGGITKGGLMSSKRKYTAASKVKIANMKMSKSGQKRQKEGGG